MAAPICPTCKLIVMGSRCRKCGIEPAPEPSSGAGRTFVAAPGAPQPAPPGEPPAGWRPDPTSRHQLRFWAGASWTDHVADDGVSGLDPYRETPPPPPPPPGGATPAPFPAATPTGTAPSTASFPVGRRSLPTDWAPAAKVAGRMVRATIRHRGPVRAITRSATEALWARRPGGDDPQGAPTPTAAVARTAVKALNVVSLGSWVSKSWQQGFDVPELVRLVQENPRDAVRHLWLAERLLELDRARQRYRDISRLGTQRLTRRAVRNLTRTRARDGWQSPADRALHNAFKVAAAVLARKPRSAPELDVLARVYRHTGLLHKSVEFAHAATLADPTYTGAYYTAAEALLAAGQDGQATQWAQAGAARGSTLAASLLDPRAPVLRKKLRRAYTASMFWQARTSCFNDVGDEELARYFGPSPLGSVSATA